MIGQECLIRSTYPATMSDVFQDFTKGKRMYILFIILSIINAFIRDNSVDAWWVVKYTVIVKSRLSRTRECGGKGVKDNSKARLFEWLCALCASAALHRGRIVNETSLEFQRAHSSPRNHRHISRKPHQSINLTRLLVNAETISSTLSRQRSIKRKMASRCEIQN